MEKKHSHRIVIPIAIVLLASLLLEGEAQVLAVDYGPPYPFYLGAPWPAGVTLHAAGDGYGYTGKTHVKADDLAMDFNGWPNEADEIVETNDKDVLVLAMADGCVKAVTYDAGQYIKDSTGTVIWHGNYGWNVVISHRGGYEARYAHLKATPLLPEQSYNPDDCYFVSQGQPIGQIGGTGTENNAAVHLHLAIYYCYPENKCTILPVLPEPLDGVSNLVDYTKITSSNYGVGYEAMDDEAVTNPAGLVFHRPIFTVYKALGGQWGYFGRSITPVLPFRDTPYFYQQFGDHGMMCAAHVTIFQAGQTAFMMPTAIWEKYIENFTQYGLPTSSAYYGNIGDGDYGWRVDFANASMSWDLSSAEPVVWAGVNTPWSGMFCPGTNNYMCTPVRRLDPYINFSFPDSNNTGPLLNTEGFSAIWETELDGNWFSEIGLGYEIQGHIRFYIDDNPISEWIPGEEGMSGQIEPKWFFNADKFSFRFWQAPGKPASILIELSESGFFPEIGAAFYPDDILGSTALAWEEGEYANFEPPPYPDEGSEVPVVPTQTPSAPPTIDLPDIDLEAWWNNLWNTITEAITQWWQETTDKLLQQLETELIQALNDFLLSLQQQCAGAETLMVAMGGGIIYWKWRKRR